MLHTPDDNKSEYARVLIIGEPGVGKTLLASTLPETYILDIEGRAAHAQRYRQTFTKDRAGLQALQNELSRLSGQQPGKDGALTHKIEGHSFPVRAVQIDSLDELQLNIDRALTSRGFDYWRDMLTLMRNIITSGRTINAHLFCIAHTREREVEFSGSDIPTVGLALQGQIGQQIPRWFDLILNIIYNPLSGTKEILTTDTMVAKKLYRAKDAHNVFGGRRLTMRFLDGRPDPSIMDTILATTVGGTVEKMFEDANEARRQAEEELKEATNRPISTEEFKEIIEQRGWDMDHDGPLFKAFTKKFGKVFVPEKGAEYVEFLTQTAENLVQQV